MNKTLEKWEEKTIKQLTTLICDGDWIESKNQSSSGIRLIQTGNVGDGYYKDKPENARYISEDTFKKLNCTEIFSGDCLVSRLPEPLGRACLIPDRKERMITAVDCSIIRFNDKMIVPKYFIYYSMSNLYHTKIINLSTGATRQRISRKNLETITIPVPKNEEQQRIVGILDEAFENIEKAKQNALQNLNNAKELFESCLDELFTKNTNNWNKYKVKDLCEYAKEQGHYNLPYVGMEHVKSSAAEFIGTLDNTEVKSTTFHFDKGIILYGRLRPYLRKVILTTFEGHCSTELFPIKVNDKVNNKFLMYWLLSQRITDKINATWTGARMPRANMNKVLEFDISIPSIMEQQKIVVQLDELQEQTKKLEQIYEQKIKDLDELKQSILQKAFNGEL